MQYNNEDVVVAGKLSNRFENAFISLDIVECTILTHSCWLRPN